LNYKEGKREGEWLVYYENGQLKRTGVTGKYANKAATCEYTIIMADFKLGAGYITGICKE